MFAGSAQWGDCFCKPQVSVLFLQFILAFKNPTVENPHMSVYQDHLLNETETMTAFEVKKLL